MKTRNERGRRGRGTCVRGYPPGGQQTTACGPKPVHCLFHKLSFIGIQAGALMYTLSMVAFMLQWQGWVIVMETVWPTP